jgi:hypothetical protein
MNRRHLLGMAALPLLAPAVAAAAELPNGPVVLTVSGLIALPNLDGTAAFDMPMLARMPQSSFVARTPWFSRPRKFTGPLLRDVLAAAGSRGPQLRAVALNDYRVEIPADDAQRFGVIVARLLDDKPMAVRDKGPLFIIYPFDDQSGLRNAVYFSRCAWQLKAIEVVNG